MPYTISYDNADNFITVSVSGELDLPLLKKMATDVAKLGKAKNCARILNDLRNAKPPKGALAVYNMPEAATNSGIIQKVKRALVVGDKTSDFYFLETVFINRGHRVRMFANMDDAKAWLLGQ